MQKILTIIYLFLLISCSSNNGDQGRIFNKLQTWDKILYQKPEEVLDSLATLSSQDLSKQNRAYYSLLITIAKNKADITEKDDSVISVAVDWYKGGSDYRNICRSLIYKDLICHDLKISDSLSYQNLKEAESIYYKFKIDDPDFESQIYTNLGRAVLLKALPALDKPSGRRLSDVNQLKESAEYYKKSIELNIKFKNYKELLIASVELYGYDINKQKELLAILNSFPDSDGLSPMVRYKLYRLYANYYTKNKDYSKANEYLRRILLIKNRNKLKEFSLPQIYTLFAINYNLNNQKDSAIYYFKLAIESSKDLQISAHGYERNLSEIYADRGDYKSAYEISTNSFVSYATYSGKRNNDQINKIRKSYDLLQKELLLAKTSRKHAIFFTYISFLLLLICLVGSFFALRKRGRIHRETRESAEEQIISMDANQNKIWFMNEILKVTAGLMPQFIEEIGIEATRSKKVSREIYDSLNHTVDNLRAVCKNKLLDITKNEKFLSSNPALEYLKDLSAYEKIILVLYNYGYSTREISEILTVAPGSIRSIKAKIKEKILTTNDLPYDPNKTFVIFNKD